MFETIFYKKINPGDKCPKNNFQFSIDNIQNEKSCDTQACSAHIKSKINHLKRN